MHSLPDYRWSGHAKVDFAVQPVHTANAVKDVCNTRPQNAYSNKNGHGMNRHKRCINWQRAKRRTRKKTE